MNHVVALHVSALAVLTGSLPLLGAGLALKQIQALGQAGVAPAVIEQRIHLEGLSFVPSEDDLDSLEKQSLAVIVREEFLHGKVSVDNREILYAGAQRYRDRSFMGSALALERYLTADPKNYGARLLAIHAYSRVGDVAARNRHCVALRDSVSDPAATPFLQEAPAFCEPEKEEALQNAVLRQLNELRGEEALAAVDQLHLLSYQKEILRYYIRRDQGNFAGALQHLATLRRLRPASAGELEPLAKELSEAAKSLAAIRQRTEWYQNAPLSNSTCSPEMARRVSQQDGYSLTEYVRLARNAARQFPLNPWVLDISFQAAILASPYDEVRTLGDQILTAKGNLRLAFYARNRRFRLLIDEKHHEITVEEESEFSPNPTGDADLQPVQSFRLGFSEIRSIDQKADADVTLSTLAKHSYALRFNGQTVVPYFMGMHALHCFYGEAAQKQATENLGKFVVHLLDVPATSAKLVNPAKQTTDWFRSVTTGMAVGAAIVADSTASSSGLQSAITGQIAAQTVAQNKQEEARQASAVEAQRTSFAAWGGRLGSTAFSQIERTRATDLTSLIDNLMKLAVNPDYVR